MPLGRALKEESMSRIRTLFVFAVPLALAGGVIVAGRSAAGEAAGADKVASTPSVQVTVRYDGGGVGMMSALDWNQGLINTMSTAGSGLPTGKRQHKPFVITKELDKSSPVLMKACASGQHIPEVKIVASRKSGGRPEPYLTITLKEVFVSSFHTSGEGATSPSSSPVPHEEIAFTFQKITWEYHDFGAVFEDTFE
jgi:type VI secretion system secreted protein Hcp